MPPELLPYAPLLASMDSALVLEFIEHVRANLDRLSSVRHLLYGLYFALVGTILTIYYADPNKKPRALFLVASLSGVATIITQILISLEIRSNFDGLNYIFNNVGVINRLNYMSDVVYKEEAVIFGIKYFGLLSHPYSLALAMIFLANIAFFLMWFIPRLKKIDIKSTFIGEITIGFLIISIIILLPWGIKSRMEHFHNKYKGFIEDSVMVKPSLDNSKFHIK